MPTAVEPSAQPNHVLLVEEAAIGVDHERDACETVDNGAVVFPELTIGENAGLPAWLFENAPDASNIMGEWPVFNAACEVAFELRIEIAGYEVDGQYATATIVGLQLSMPSTSLVFTDSWLEAVPVTPLEIAFESDLRFSDSKARLSVSSMAAGTTNEVRVAEALGSIDVLDIAGGVRFESTRPDAFGSTLVTFGVGSDWVDRLGLGAIRALRIPEAGGTELLDVLYTETFADRTELTFRSENGMSDFILLALAEGSAIGEAETRNAIAAVASFALGVPREAFAAANETAIVETITFGLEPLLLLLIIVASTWGRRGRPWNAKSNIAPPHRGLAPSDR